MANARHLFATSKKRKRAGDGKAPVATANARAPADTLVTQHACMLELQALLFSCPYTLEQWMHEVLLCVAAAARAPEPVRKAATSALGHFRTNQAATSPLPLRDRLPEDVWDSIQGVASTSTYFV